MRALIKSRVKSRKQSASSYAFQELRIKWLRGVLGGISTSELLHAKVRNTLEHFRKLQREGKLDTADLDG